MIDKEKLKALAESARDYAGEDMADHESALNALACEVDAVTVLSLLAEIGRLDMDNRSLKGSCSKLGAEHAGMSRLYKKANRMQLEARLEREQLKVENESLRQDAERYRWLCEKYGVTQLPCFVERILGGGVYVADGKTGVDAAIESEMASKA